MTKLIEKSVPGLPADQRLAGDFQRVVMTGQSVLRISSVDENEAIALAKETAGRLPSLPTNAKLADRKDLLSLFDDVNDVAERLKTEQALVRERLRSSACHGAARQAYQRGISK